MSHKSDIMNVIKKIMAQKRCPVCGIPSEDDVIMLEAAIEALDSAFGRVISDSDQETRLKHHEQRIRGNEQIINGKADTECFVWIAVTVPEYREIMAGNVTMIAKAGIGGTKLWNKFKRQGVTFVRINRYYTSACTDRVFVKMDRGPATIKGVLVDDCVRVHFSQGEI